VHGKLKFFNIFLIAATNRCAIGVYRAKVYDAPVFIEAD
jgi:hypothetical protein